MKNTETTIRMVYAIDWLAPEDVDLPDKVFLPESVDDLAIHKYLFDKFGYQVHAYSMEEVDLPFDASLPFPWTKFEITDKELEKYGEMEEEEIISVKTEFFNAVLDDGDDEFRNLIYDYRHADASVRSAIDATLVRVCGWSLPTLCRMAEATAAHHDDFPREEQESVLGEMLGYLSEFSTFDAKESFNIEDDEDFSKWSPIKLYELLCEVGAYLYELWESNHSDAEIRDKLIDMGIPETSQYMDDFDFEIEN